MERASQEKKSLQLIKTPVNTIFLLFYFFQLKNNTQL